MTGVANILLSGYIRAIEQRDAAKKRSTKFPLNVKTMLYFVSFEEKGNDWVF